MLFLFMITFVGNAFSQNVTSSFDRNVLGTNPSAATTRGFAQFALSQTFKNVDSEMTQEFDGAEDRIIDEEVKLSTSELRLTGGHAQFIPELYLGQNMAEKNVRISDSDDESNTDLSFLDNFLNLGYRYSPRIGLGLKLYFPTFGFKETLPGTTQDGTKYKGVFEFDQRTIGFTVGTTIALTKTLYIGFMVGFDKEQRHFKGSYRDFLTNEKVNQDDATDESSRRYGVGISYLSGSSRKHGLRAELSYTMMNVPDDDGGNQIAYDNGAAAEIKAALEIARGGLSFGGNMRMVKMGFYDQGDYIEKFFIQKPTTPDFSMTFGGFLSFNSDRGNSLGVSGYWLPSDGERRFQGADQPAKSTTTMFNVNYAYLF